MEKIWKHEKVFPVLSEESRQYIARNRRMNDFICSLLEEVTVSVGPLDEYNKYVKAAIRSIEERYIEKLTLNSISKAAGTSRSNLERLFRKDTGYSVVEYLEICRISKAKKMLLSGQVNISEAAYKSGYSDPFYFSNVFKKKTGVSPSKYK
ncbi:MAG: hypothetical protein A2231_02080 [Candidatus Firestonebacteria bacterium RIFOXYA2_FULL_40_8]|nr:MAG: hypothetical protein A2231_02080 [Candidatus Firestonebacteria bacterium RIFOXYA2_FULL_40_8]